MNGDDRPNPDELLARVAAEEELQRRGKLKIFFGAAPGVGKTYAMLEAGRKLAKEGVDVLVGYVEPHVRPETMALVLGLDILERKIVSYRGKDLHEFDLEAALARRPKLILVDELAHTNAPGLLHAKRWQDVEDLLAAGIDVYTTLNVQHIESLKDVVAQITGVTVRETVPDSILDQADEIELVDIAPDDLIERLREGRVYLPDQAARAIQNFFSKGNLIALRELALRRAAERVDRQMEDYRRLHAVSQLWPANERLLVCVGPSPSSARLIRATRRMASGLRSTWHAVHVETPANAGLSNEDRERLAQSLHLAEELGATCATLHGASVADEVVRYARAHNITQIIVGKPHQPRWREVLRGSYVYELSRKCGDIDLHVISGDPGERARVSGRSPAAPIQLKHYAGAIALVAVATGIGALLFPYVEPLNLIMVYLVELVFVSIWFGRGPSVLASFLSVLLFDFVFIPPYWTFAVTDTEYLFTFVVMLFTGLTISALTTRVSWQAEAARQREQRTAALYSMSRDLVNARSYEELARSAGKHVGAAFQADVFLLLPNGQSRSSRLSIVRDHGAGQTLSDHDLAVASWVFEHREPAGRGSDTLPSAEGLFFPLVVEKQAVAVFGVRPFHRIGSWTAEQRRLLETFAGQIGLAVERIRAVDEADRARIAVETEQLRNSLLSAVSHDLRTPLAAITGASSTLLDDAAHLEPTARRELAESIFDEATRLNRLVANLLDMTRLEAGALVVQRQWQPIEEPIGVVLNRLARPLMGRQVAVELAPDLPLVAMDDLLIQQVLLNLLENALKFTPSDSPIAISAKLAGGELLVEVADRGPGIPADETGRLFDKFYQSGAGTRRSGVGLGLAVCRGIVEAHGGRIWVENRSGGGAAFRFTLPLGQAPALPGAEELPPAEVSGR